MSNDLVITYSIIYKLMFYDERHKKTARSQIMWIAFYVDCPWLKAIYVTAEPPIYNRFRNNKHDSIHLSIK